jgi:hypothetical protein
MTPAPRSATAVGRDAAAYTTRAVMAGERPILLVSHEVGGNWQFLDGDPVDIAEGVVVHLAHIVDAHPELSALADLQPGWAAERASVEGDWRRYRLAE